MSKRIVRVDSFHIYVRSTLQQEESTMWALHGPFHIGIDDIETYLSNIAKNVQYTFHVDVVSIDPVDQSGAVIQFSPYIDPKVYHNL